jgi:hypothetical protein
MPASTVLNDRYRLDTVLGRGGMGVVWEGFDELLHRQVAVKEINFPEGMSEADRHRLADRTLREARAVAAVETRAAVRVFDVVEQAGKPWLVMELVRGRTLTDVIRANGSLASVEVAKVGLALLTALEATHAAGVLHRDVKPSNVLVGDDGRIALTDFGIATTDQDPVETTSSVIVGSPAYIAPERIRGEPPTSASDLWSLGATLWTAVEGRPPFAGPTPFVVMHAVATAEPPLSDRSEPRLRALLVELMATAPADRPAPEAIRQRLTDILASPAHMTSSPLEVTAALPTDFDRTTVLDATGGAKSAPPVTAATPAASAAAEAAVAAAAAPPGDADATPATPATPAGRGRGWLVLLAISLLMLAAAGGLLASRLSSGPPSAHHRPTTGRTATTSAKAAVPTGFTRYTDPSLGWSVAVPPGWQRVQTTGGTRFDDPAGGRYVLIATRDPAGPSAVGAWRAQEQAFRTQHTGYQRLELHTTTVPGASDAADWLFRYTQDGASLEALDHAVVVGGVGYAVYFQTHVDQWASSAAIRSAVLASFHPASH